MVKFITVKKYAELTGYSEEAIRQKTKKGIWILNKEVTKAPDGRLMINIEEVEAWIRHKQKA